MLCEEPLQHSTTIELAFYTGGMRYVYTVTFTKENILEEEMVFYTTHQPTLLFLRTTDTDKRVSAIKFGNKIKAAQKEKDNLETVTLHNNTVLGAHEKTNVDLPDLDN